MTDIVHINRMPALPDTDGNTGGNLRPSSTVLLNDYPDMSIDDLVGAEILMQAVALHYDPPQEHAHTAPICLKGFVAYFWSVTLPETSPHAEQSACGFYILDANNLRHDLGAHKMVFPMQVRSVMEHDADGDIALRVLDTVLSTPALWLANKQQIQGTRLTLDANDALSRQRDKLMRQGESTAADMVQAHLAAFFHDLDDVDVDDMTLLPLPDLVDDPTYVIVIPHIQARLIPLMDAMLGALRHLDIFTHPPYDGLAKPEHEEAMETLAQEISGLTSFFVLNILPNLSTEWWQTVFAPTILHNIERGMLTVSPTPRVSTHDEPEPEALDPQDYTGDFWDDLRSLL